MVTFTSVTLSTSTALSAGLSKRLSAMEPFDPSINSGQAKLRVTINLCGFTYELLSMIGGYYRG